MLRFFWILSCLFMVMAGGGAVRAQENPVPDFRYLSSPDTDYYGSDLQALFDTNLKSCIQACAGNSQCVGFTFNTRSNACFPKSAVKDQTEYVGAVSAVKLATVGAVVQTGTQRRAAMPMLRPDDISFARTQAIELGIRHQQGGLDIEEIIDAARIREASNDRIAAIRLTGRAIAISDRADLWVDYARLLLSLRTDNSSLRREYHTRAVGAAINGYLRAPAAGGQISALMMLAEGLERSGRGRDMLAVLRVAERIQPRVDVREALDRAVRKYGFRVTGSSVESDSRTPRICIEFSEKLAQAGVDYDPFVRLPQPDLVVQADGRQLCVEGVKHGNRYRLTLRSGLPAESSETLFKDVDLTQYVRDRSPAVRFPGRSYVLAKSAQAALPVETVNLTDLDLKLRRVSDRNLLRAMQEGYFGRPLSYWQEEEFTNTIAEDVWSGTAKVQTELNRDLTTRLPMAEAIAGQPAGIYALTATIPGADPYDQPGATQWFVLSDLGISSMSGTDGLHVQVLGLGDAAARPDVKVSLISRTNAVLATAQTDAAGSVRFDPGLIRGTGGSEPAMLIARQGDSDLGFLSLIDPAFDLSDRGVEGRNPAGPVDVFMTTDRGAYRAGEVIHVTALTRDGRARAIEGLPLIAILSRPDGVEYSRVVSDGGRMGGHVFDLPVGVTAPRGTWRLDLKTDPKAPALASRQILVEDFLPERIDFDQSLASQQLTEGDAVDLRVQARYLFGAPGAGLKVEGQVSLRAAETVQGWPGYRFGRHDGPSTTQSSYFGSFETDADGVAILPVEIPQGAAEGKPLTARVITRVADGSARPVERMIEAPVRSSAPVIGIKPLFDDVFSEGTEAGFEVIALSPTLEPMPIQVVWTLNRIETRYQWYQLHGNWNWEPITRRTRIATGQGVLDAGPLRVSHPVEWGQYELVVERTDGPHVVGSVDFYAGWYAPGDSSATPDQLELSLNSDIYVPGDTARLRIVSRSAGTALISVMSDRLISRQAIEVPEGASEIPLEVTEDWGAGAYVSAMVVRPGDHATGQTPVRTLGLAHAAVTQQGQSLTVSIDVPEVARPRQKQKARVSVSGSAPGDEVWMTVSAVDLGILNLTGFQSPDPSAYYFGQRRLGMELRDVYGRLIDTSNGALGLVRSGGDQDNAMRMQSPPPTQDLMAVFSGAVQVDADGIVEIPLDLPAFNGTVRLMAVAWSGLAVGQAEADMLVRDPVVVTASLPRFLAPGDQSRALLEIVHADGPTGDMQLVVSAGDELLLGPVPSVVTLDSGGKVNLEVPVAAQSVGDPEVLVTLVTPDGQAFRQTLRLPVRANDPEVAQTRRFTLASGDSFAFTQDVFAGLRPGSARAVISAGPLAKFDAPGLLSALDRYPYGCTEQVTSKAMPLLYLSSLAQASGLGDGPKVDGRIRDAINRVLTRQASNGSFGLWRAESGDFWLDAYVSDFLSRARAQGHQVPERAFAQAMDNLRNRVNYAPDFDTGGEDIAYALMVLAREGAASMGDLRYYVDVKAEGFDTPLAAAQLGAALAFYGDQTRADRMFSHAAILLNRAVSGKPIWRVDYGTRLRDTAGVLSLAVDAGSTAVNRDFLINRVTRASGPLSTQEAAWSLLAAQSLINTPEESGVLVDGNPVDGPFVQVMDGQAPGQGVLISAASGQATDITLTTLGVSETGLDAGGTGYTLERLYFTLEGVPIDRRDFAVGERLVTVLRVTPHESVGARLMINDPLPAGIEIDNPNLLRSGDLRDLDWLNLSEATHVEFRSDRFLAAVDWRGSDVVTLGYVARAVTPGAFHHPAASVEDMYRPVYRAHTGTGRVIVR
ncbi:alpha-2-macroglobulin family protein [Rhodobacteraceae bacterium M382]|nr:alpha-2-macroglobulin family protein [Rhodobacteraceae bacterium M382]